MNFNLTDEQRMLREMVREFSEKEIKPRAAEIDRTDEFPWDLWKRMGELGLLGMTLPPEYGGSGMDTVSWAIAQEEMSRASVVVADIQLATKVMQDMILRNGSSAQTQAYLPALGRGEKLCKQRVAFGQPIGHLQAIQFKLADMSAGIEAARWRLRHAAWLKDQGRPIIREAAEAKLLASDLAVKVTSEALQIHGAYGYSTDFPIERMYRDAKVYQIWEGTSEIQRMVIGRQLLKEY